MSVVSDVSSRESSLSQFLAQAGPSAAKGAPISNPGQFAEELNETLGQAPAEAPRTIFSTTPSIGSDTLSFVTSPSRSAAASPPAAAPSVVGPPVDVPGPDAPAASLPPYDPVKGSVITKEMWTEQLLTEDISSDTLQNIKDPADFLKARLDHVRKPTEAKVVNDTDGGSTPINSSFLSTREQAEGVRDRLRDLGIDVGDIKEISISGGPFAMDWGSEDRRAYTVNGMSVGLILERYARNSSDYADRMMLDQFQTA